MNQPLISVIVPIYNVEKYLDKCVNSIVSQTYKNLEIILVDDGSPDNCPAMCDEWAKKDSRIKVIHKTNGGLSDARNFGLDIATGDYISFVDSDDYINHNMIEILLHGIKNNNSDIALCSINKVNENNEIISITSVEDSNIIGIEAFNNIYDVNYAYVVAWNKLYASHIFTDLRYPKGKIHEDEFIIHHIYSKCNRITTINKPLYNYLIRSNSIIGAGFSLKSMAFYEAMIDRLNLFNDNKLPKELYWKTKASLLTWCQEKLYLCKNSNSLNNQKYDCIKKLKEYIRNNIIPLLFNKNIKLKKKAHIVFGFMPNLLKIIKRFGN